MSETTQLMEQPKVSSTCAVDTLDEQLGQFKGRIDPRATVFDFITEQIARSSRSDLPPSMAQPELEGSAAEGLVQPISDYLALIIRIGEAMANEAGENRPGAS